MIGVQITRFGLRGPLDPSRMLTRGWMGLSLFVTQPAPTRRGFVMRRTFGGNR